ncbi:MAG: patatin-like phospholipase family protein [Acidobacteria bacterium]|nr:patatin-like phospholipase family protein [Acidobacteriota bacterium]
MPRTYEIPLHLCQVLEEEFESLHETLDWNDEGDSVPVKDGGRTVDVTVKADWDFHPNHARREALAERLREAYGRWKRTHPAGAEPVDRECADGSPWVEPDLAAYLAKKFPALTRRQGQGETDEEADRGLADALNEVLGDAEVFKPCRFERAALRDDTRGLFELVWERAGGGLCADRGGDSDLRRFRRLLLEDSLPDELRRAEDLRLARVMQRVHELRAQRSAICLSGGGIRSGTFALGVIQSLARRGFLERFDYLSTVSGGGYIGGWLSAWIHRHPRGLSGVVSDLKGEGRSSKLGPEPEPLRHLRDYSNFITPKTGMLSADAWTFVTIYVRNLLLNWVVLVPLLASLLMIPRVANAAVLAAGDWWTLVGLLLLSGVGAWLLNLNPLKALRVALDNLNRWHVLFFVLLLLAVAGAFLAADYFWPEREVLVAAAFATPSLALLVLGTLLNGFAVAFMRLNRPSNSGVIRPGSFWDKRRDQNSFLRLCLVPLCLSATLLTTYWAWYTRALPHRDTWPEMAGFLLFGALVGVTGVTFYWLFVRQTWKDDPAERELKELRQRPGREDDPAARAKEEKLAGVVDKRNADIGRSFVREGIVMLAASVLGALLLWVAAVKIPPFDSPFVNPFGEARFAGGVVRPELLPYTQWWGAEFYTALAFPVYLLVIFLGVTLFVGLSSRRTERAPRQRDEQRARREAERARKEAERARREAERAEKKPGVAAAVAAAVGEDEEEPKDPFVSYGRYFIEDEDREWLARAGAWLLIVMAAWLFFCGLVIFGPLLYFAFQKWLLAAGGLSGLVAILGGGSAKTPGKSKKEGERDWLGTLKTVGVNIVVLAAFIFFACLVLVVAMLTGAVIAWLGQYLPAALAGERGAEFAAMYPFTSAQNAFRVAHFPTWLYLSLLALALHGVGRFGSLVINLNKFSLHAGYRDRIIRAFLGASRPKGERQANPFTGFDPRDNLFMDELRPWVLRESDFEGANGLVSFVAALAGEDAETRGTPEKRAAAAAAARYLRAEIDNMDGQSRKYFERRDPPESIATNPSFRTALFGDLSRILQVSRLEDAPEFAANLDEVRRDYASLAASRDDGGEPRGPAEPGAPGAQPAPVNRLLLNRLLLVKAFPYHLKYPPRLHRLMHVVNMALNLVGGDKLAWQQRRAESFTSTPLHSGSLFVGYRRTRDYGGKSGIALGTAVAISGAAASSNMGYFSPSPFVTLALTFFNARLGWWLGNPGVHGALTFYRSHPRSALSPILDEAFGLTDDKNPYVLLSDGGHFENLGLYEMVLRRCRNIVVVDGSADPAGALEGLGDAVRKIRIDLGIPIEFRPPFPILPRPASEEKGAGGYCAVGDIHYEAVDAAPGERVDAPGGEHKRHKLTGHIIYVKPTIYGTEPRDIYNYAVSHPDFPHESTADQFFDEPQFESHRMLGYYIIEQLFEEATHGPDGRDFSEERDLRAFVDWLDERAGRERGEAAGGKKNREEKDDRKNDKGLKSDGYTG